MAGRRRTIQTPQQGALPVEDYRHTGASRLNNPPAAIAAEGRTPPAPKLTYAYSPRLDPVLRSDPSGGPDALPPLLEKAKREPLSAEEAALLAEALRRHEPWLEWAGKRETPRFAVDPVALHIHERVSAQAILRMAARQDVTRDLFADPGAALRAGGAVLSARHGLGEPADPGRFVAGDGESGAAGEPRGQGADDLSGPALRHPLRQQFPAGDRQAQRVTDREADLTREPEMVRAYRDTWRLGVHSYLAYLRDRLIVARTLLAETGSIFVQIGDENVHRVRALMDEIFGSRAVIFLHPIVKPQPGGPMEQASLRSLPISFCGTQRSSDKIEVPRKLYSTKDFRRMAGYSEAYQC